MEVKSAGMLIINPGQITGINDKIKIIPAGEELDKYHKEAIGSQSMVIRPLANQN